MNAQAVRSSSHRIVFRRLVRNPILWVAAFVLAIWVMEILLGDR